MYVTENEPSDSMHKLSDTGTVAVPVVTIDDDISEPVTLIKMDIEGGEQKAILGCRSIFRRIIRSSPYRFTTTMRISGNARRMIDELTRVFLFICGITVGFIILPNSSCFAYRRRDIHYSSVPDIRLLCPLLLSYSMYRFLRCKVYSNLRIIKTELPGKCLGQLFCVFGLIFLRRFFAAASASFFMTSGMPIDCGQCFCSFRILCSLPVFSLSPYGRGP